MPGRGQEAIVFGPIIAYTIFYLYLIGGAGRLSPQGRAPAPPLISY